MTTPHLAWNDEELMVPVGNIVVTPTATSPEDLSQGYSWTCRLTVEKPTEEQEAYKKELFAYLKRCQERNMPLYYSYSGFGKVGITVDHTAERFIEPSLKQKIKEVCLRGPKVLNGIAPTQGALDSFLVAFALFPVFPGVKFITRRRISRDAFDAFHFDDPNQFIPQEYIKKALAAMRETAQPALGSKMYNLNNKNILAPDPEMWKVLKIDLKDK